MVRLRGWVIDSKPVAIQIFDEINVVEMEKCLLISSLS